MVAEAAMTSKVMLKGGLLGVAVREFLEMTKTHEKCHNVLYSFEMWVYLVEVLLLL